MPQPPAEGPGTRLPARYLVWLSGAAVSQLGDAALYFALGWAASAYGGAAAGLVLSAISLPRAVLLLVGGAAGDRRNASAILIAGDALMLVVTAALALVAAAGRVPLPMLVGFGAVVGAVDAFYLPSSGSMPRRLISDGQLDQGIALRQAASQTTGLIGGPFGALLVAAAGLAAAAAADAVTFGFALIAMAAVRHSVAGPAPQSRRLLGDIGAGVRLVAGDASLRVSLLLVAGVAGFAIPVGSLLIPMTARSHHWLAGAAGLVVLAQGAGTVVVSVLAARRGVGRHVGNVALLGIGLAAAGTLALAVAATVATAMAAAVVVGGGLGLFVTRLGPLLMRTAPRPYLARVQSMLTLAQSAVLLLTQNALGNLVAATSASTALTVCACVLAAAALFGLSQRRLLGGVTG